MHDPRLHAFHHGRGGPQYFRAGGVHRRLVLKHWGRHKRPVLNERGQVPGGDLHTCEPITGAETVSKQWNSRRCSGTRLPVQHHNIQITNSLYNKKPVRKTHVPENPQRRHRKSTSIPEKNQTRNSRKSYLQHVPWVHRQCRQPRQRKV